MLKKKIALAVVVAVLFLGLLPWLSWLLLDNYIKSTKIRLDPEETWVYMIKPGTNLKRVAADLAEKMRIQYPGLLVLYARVVGLTAIQTGEYQFEHGMTLLSLLKQINDGDVIKYRITLLEGWNIRQVLAALAREEKLVQLLRGLDDQQIITALGINISHLEGQFFPDTYYYQAGMSDKDILLRAHRRMVNVLAELWPQRSDNAPYASPYEALIMASIVEKESGLVAERERIAGVFVERLKRNMRLQTDPTVIYGLGEAFDGNLTRRHLKTPTPYNTYTQFGLPPTPIAIPSAGAIAAALHPALEGYIYFVAKGDGSHQFSKTLAAHNQAVRQYQINQRAKNYRSRPHLSPKDATATSKVKDKQSSVR